MTSNPIRGMRQKMRPGTVAGNLTNSPRQGHEHTVQELALALKPYLGVSASAASPASAAAAPVLHGIGFFIGGIMLADELLGGVTFTKDFTVTSGNPFAINSLVPAAANAVLHFVTGFPDTVVGQIAFAAASTTGVLTFSADPYTLPAGTQLRLRSPNPADATLAYVSGTIQGNLA